MTDIPARALIVDDDPQIRTMLQRYLTDQGLLAEVADGGTNMTRQMEKIQFDIIIMDVMMPGEDGISLCRKIRGRSQVPIILLTAVSTETDRIIGLEVGADDYMVKPFNPRELLARIRAVLRRTAELKTIKPQGNPENVTFDGWKMNLLRRTLVNPTGALMDLTSNEFDLLAVFVQKPLTLLSRDQLLDLTHGKNANQLNRSIDVQVSRLRRKLEADPQSPQIIKTMRSEGYMFTAVVERVE